MYLSVDRRFETRNDKLLPTRELKELLDLR
jgi:hypothetical protein